MSIELKVGEWYENRSGERVKVIADMNAHGNRIVGDEDAMVVLRFSGWYGCTPDGKWSPRTGESFGDIVRHLPGCTGWDWVEPDAGWRDAKPSDFAEGVPVPCRVRDSKGVRWHEAKVLGYMAEAEFPFIVDHDLYDAGDGAYEVTAYRYCQVLDTENT